MTDFCEIQKLVELFKEKTENSDSEDEVGDGKAGPSNINPSKKKPARQVDEGKVNPYSKIETEVKRKEILDPDADNDFVFEDGQQGVEKDWKKTPIWDVKYKQQVTAEDIFLQMSFKNPTSASCEDMIITIDLPEEKHQNIDLKILKDKLTLTSPRFYLDLPLPHPVDPQRGNAQWDKDQQKLMVTLRMDRELDLVNF